MTIFRSFTKKELTALKQHGLDTDGPSQLSDAFVLGMRQGAASRRVKLGKWFENTPHEMGAEQWESLLKAADAAKDTP